MSSVKQSYYFAGMGSEVGKEGRNKGRGGFLSSCLRLQLTSFEITMPHISIISRSHRNCSVLAQSIQGEEEKRTELILISKSRDSGFTTSNQVAHLWMPKRRLESLPQSQMGSLSVIHCHSQ